MMEERAPDDPLQRRFTRLVRLYPRWYQRERGAELVTTLLESSAPGRRRPTMADVLDTVRGALRCRLVPPRRTYGLVPLAAAATLALPAAAAALPLTDWPGPPQQASAVAAATTALGPPPADIPGPVVHCSALCPSPADPADPVVSYDYDAEHTDLVSIRYPAPAREPDDVVGSAGERLVAAGWKLVVPLRRQVDTWGPCAEPTCSKPRTWASLTATRHGLQITVSASRERDTAEDATLGVSVSNQKSLPVALAVLAGAAGGLLGGWLLGVWATHRYRRMNPRRRVVPLLAGLPGLALGTLMSLSATNAAISSALDGGEARDVQIPASFLGLLPPVTWFPLISLSAFALLTALPVPLAAPPDERRPARAR